MTRASDLTLALIVALAALLALPFIGQQSLWVDEAFTLRVVDGDLAGLLGRISETESTPPLFYALTWPAVWILGPSEAPLRLVSGLAYLAALPVVYAIGRRVAGSRVGLFAAGLAAVNPLFLWHAQEARAYSLLVLVSALSVLFTLEAERDPRARVLALWGLVAVLAVLTHPFGALIVGAEALFLLVALGARRKQLLLAVAAPLVAVGALMPLAVAQAGTGHYGGIAGEVSLLVRLAAIPKQLAAGFDAPAEVPASIVLTGLMGVAVVAGFLASIRQARPLVHLAAWVGGFVILLPLAAAVIGFDVVHTRNLLSILPLVCVLAALGVQRLAEAHTHLAVGLVAVWIAVSLAAWLGVLVEPRLQKDDWRGAVRAAAHLLEPAEGDDPVAVAFSPQSGHVPLREAYLPEGRPPPEGQLAQTLVLLDTKGDLPDIPPVPVPENPSPVAGFQLAGSIATDSYRLLHYASPEPAYVPPAFSSPQADRPATTLILDPHATGRAAP